MGSLFMVSKDGNVFTLTIRHEEDFNCVKKVLDFHELKNTKIYKLVDKKSHIPCFNYDQLEKWSPPSLRGLKQWEKRIQLKACWPLEGTSYFYTLTEEPITLKQEKGSFCQKMLDHL